MWRGRVGYVTLVKNLNTKIGPVMCYCTVLVPPALLHPLPSALAETLRCPCRMCGCVRLTVLLAKIGEGGVPRLSLVISGRAAEGPWVQESPLA